MDSSAEMALKAELSGVQALTNSTNSLLADATNAAASPAAAVMICNALKMRNEVTKKTLTFFGNRIEKA